MKKFLRVNDLKEITPSGLDGHRYLLSIDVGGVIDGVFKPTDTRQVTVTSSGTLQAVWGQDDTQLAESSATAATSLILRLASEGKIDEASKIDLNTYTAPEVPPASPKAIAGTILPIPEQITKREDAMLFSFLSGDISEVRDQINALARNLLGEKILELPQERAILDVYKPAQSAEEFRSRVQSLAGISTSLNKLVIGKELGKNKTNDIGSIILLEELLTKFSDKIQASSVCMVLKNINELRKGYPAHGDNTDKFLDAHDFFRISYPVKDHQSSWESILGAYFKAMKELREILSMERSKRNASNRANQHGSK